MDDFRSLSPAVWRASTVLFDNIADFTSRKERVFDGYTYGVTGTPTTRALEERIAQLEGARFCVIAPSGQAALCQVGLALLSAGDHVLIADSAYGPLRTFARDYLQRFGVQCETYDPSAGAEIAQRIRPQTKLIFMESPGSLTMEMQDIPAIVQAAKAAGVLTVLDNSWASPLGFQGVVAGVDIVVEAASKWFGGHSDLLLGSIATDSRALYEKFRTAQSVLGQAVSPDDCFLALRGLDTFALRYTHQCASALAVAERLARHASVAGVLFPPRPGDRGHARWAASFQGGGSVLSFVPAFQSSAQVHRFFDALKAFQIGASWGGVHSLAAYYPETEQARRNHCQITGGIVRLAIGLEPVEQLAADIEQALGLATLAA
ncbi:PLP-dependent aspartate aminotransferase family protein [Acidovorax sp. CCYZU-2555]|uniref:trans-sulfuration enzyme family protein n=1 Tax=Acidovorax sp. CCYZU-2555 TaxID=2835042 RepID=UPI001BD021CB|nr:PLP-dependent aspartate aminotransferase family protein [Acidovorax sp. CCYZU-2555]MBS7779350.1 PLP-dependent transferase [Acidovorax sp. CCYZU-2555]